MKKQNKKQVQRSKFSLLEVVIAITIVALIAAIAVPRLLGQADEAKAHTAKIQIQSFNGAISQHKIDTGKMPDSLEGLVTNTQNLKGWKPYLELIPLDPWNNSYVFELDSTKYNKCEIISYGADGQPGGEGVDADITLSAKPQD